MFMPPRDQTWAKFAQVKIVKNKSKGESKKENFHASQRSNLGKSLHKWKCWGGSLAKNTWTKCNTSGCKLQQKILPIFEALMEKYFARKGDTSFHGQENRKYIVCGAGQSEAC